MEASSQSVGKGAGSARLGIALGVLALVLSVAAVGLTVTRSGVPARTIAITVTIDEGLVVTGYNTTCQCAVQIDSPEADTEKVVGEYVRWSPNVITINKGDTVTLTVRNPRGGDHSFSIDASAGAFSGTTSSGTVQGRANSGNPDGTEATIEFTALRAGTYTFRCTIPFDDANDQCHPDHDTLTGTLVVQ